MNKWNIDLFRNETVIMHLALFLFFIIVERMIDLLIILIYEAPVWNLNGVQ